MGDAANYIPALKLGHKIYPQNIAMMAGMPVVGNIFFVDSSSGSDSAGGKTWTGAFKTASQAEDSCVTNNYDVILVAPNGTTGTAETAGITWDKNHITVLGAAAPVPISQRSRIVTTTDAVDPCHTISGQGNKFLNVQLATYQASNDVLVSITNNRNYFSNVHFAGIGHATAGDDTTARCIEMTAGEENLFDGCTIGLDTIARSVANALLEQTGSCPRNTYRDCDFNSRVDDAAALSVKLVTGNCNERFIRFTRCTFHNPDVAGSATKMTVHFDTAGAGNGTIILDACSMNGATDWADDFTAMFSANIAEQPTGTTAGIMQVLS